MKVLDAELDSTPTSSKVVKMAEARIRNLQCFEELQSFNDTGKWKNKHPLLIHQSERFKLEDLKNKDPEAFLKKYANTSHNIKRYKSFLNNDERKDKHKADKKNLTKHLELKVVFEDILKKDDERDNSI